MPNKRDDFSEIVKRTAAERVAYRCSFPGCQMITIGASQEKADKSSRTGVMPFIGKAHVAYIPNGTITGLSKIARVVETFARRLQVQERLTTQILNCIQDTLNPLGVAVVIEASHTCMTLRGVQKANAVTTTSAFSGIFLKDERTRNEFLNLIK